MLGISPWFSLLAVLAAALLARAVPAARLTPFRRALDQRWAPVLVGALTGAISVWVWGSLQRSAVAHDESAYLLQAQLFAQFRWTGEGHTLPRFFEQLYVLVDPVLASKYPPGHSLLLAPGIWIGLPGLPVVILNAVAGGLFFALARRISNSLTALVSWVAWLTSFPMLYYHANYMSEAVTSMAWLLTWWSILRWHEGDGARWLALAAGAVAWSAITRPLTAAAFGVVAIAVVIRVAWTRRRWADLLPASAVALAIVGTVPLWSWRTTGDARVTPLAAYTRTYVPFDKPGFGVAPGSQPSRRLPRDQWITSATFYRGHAEHTPERLPSIARDRLAMLDCDAFCEWRGGLRVFALVGVLTLPAAAWVALAAIALHFVLYLSYAHPAGWTIYYVEGGPLMAFITALGIVRVLAWLTAIGGVGASAADRPRHRLAELFRALFRKATAPIAPTPRLTLAIALLVAMAILPGALVARQVRAKIAADHAYHEAFTELLGRIPESRAVVFVRYGPQHQDWLSLVRNVSEPRQAAILTVYDRGADNGRLIESLPDRVPYLFDEASWTLQRLQRRIEPPRTSGVASARTPSVTTPRR